MKQFLLMILMLLLMSCAPAQAGWFDSKDDTKERLTKAEQQLTEQRATNDLWEIVSAVLGVGCVLLFTIGTAIGARTRHDARPQ